MSQEPFVVVADDYEDGRVMLAEFLKAHGFNVVEARTGLEAVALVRRYQARAAVLDVAMPQMDGLQAARKLKGDPRTKNVFVVALTAHAFKNDEEAAREAGCDAYIAKPHDMASLANVLRQAVSGA